MSIDFYRKLSHDISKLITKRYSTSFSLATSCLGRDKKEAIYSIYGFVRLADEIVDSFHDYDQAYLLSKLKEDLAYALDKGISTNTILTSFSSTVRKYNIREAYITAFLQSMEFDLDKSHYTKKDDLNTYIYGSADVIGLMCLQVFCDNDTNLFERLKEPAQRLGSAFQKVNFIRDLKDDIGTLGRSYFPEITHSEFNAKSKAIIEQSIQEDFDAAWIGIKGLPGRSKLAVALAYFYYQKLFNKIKKTDAEVILAKRIRISNLRKYFIIINVALRYRTKTI